MGKKEFVVFDLEATCYGEGDPKKPKDFTNEIIEIGAVKLDSDGNEIDRFSKFARPLVHPIISEFCNELTTITQEDIDNAEELGDVLAQFIEWVDGATLVSWGFYDRKQMEKDLISNDLEYLSESLETHQSLKHLHGSWNNLGRSGIGLGGAMKFEKLNFEGTAHRGIDDAINIAKIFRKYIDRF
jgi:inhibitor of KinA sporulation pathway (predicted exonuclease)